MSEARPRLSVVIPSFNSRATIRACLGALLRQTLARDDYEILVVDSSTDGTDGIISEEFPGVRLVRLERKTLPGPARNIGIQNAKADLIMFTDSDCVAAEDVLARMMARHHGGRFAVVGGAILNGTPRSPVGWVDYLMSFSPFMPSLRERPMPQLPTCNACYRLDALRRSGFFPAYNFLAEDLILNWRIFRSGGSLFFDPTIRVTHINRTGLTGHLKHQWKLGWSFALALRCTDMRWRLFVRFPALAVFLPLIRFGSLLARVARRDLRVFGLALVLSPLYLLGASWWAAGFASGATMEEEEFRGRLLADACGVDDLKD